MKVLIFLIFNLFFARILKPPKQNRKTQLDMYMLGPMEIAAQTKYLMGQGDKGNKIAEMKGGLLNVILGNEGAPIYIDQSPSYLYKNPKTRFNQNGVKLPFPNLNDDFRTKQTPMVKSNFIKPKNYDNSDTVFLPPINSPYERRLTSNDQFSNSDIDEPKNLQQNEALSNHDKHTEVITVKSNSKSIEAQSQTNNRIITKSSIKNRNLLDKNKSKIVRKADFIQSAKERRLASKGEANGINFFDVVPDTGEKVMVAKPDGAIVETALNNVNPTDESYQLEAVDQMSKSVVLTDRLETIKDLIMKIKMEVNGLNSQISQRNDHVDVLLNRIYNMKVT